MYGIYENGVVIAKFVAPVSVISNVPIFASDSLSLKRQVAKRPAQRWEVSSNLEPLSYKANDLFALFVQKGHSDVIQITMPQNFGAAALLTTTSLPTATALGSATSVPVLNNNGLIPRGTFIKFSNHSKIYMLTQNLDGNGNMQIFPELRAAVSSASISYGKSVLMTCKIDTETVTGMSYTDGILMDLGSVKLVEDV